jgi:hypothetical protein
VTPEARFQQQLTKVCKDMGLWCPRIETSHTEPGLPDRMLVLQGHVIFLELKVHGGYLTPAQVVVHHKLALHGIIVRVLTRTSKGVTVKAGRTIREYNSLREAMEAIIK